MKVLNLGSLDVKEGGPTLSTYLGMKGVERSGWRTAIAMAPLQPGGRLIAEDVETIVCREPRLGRLQWIPGFADSIEAAGEVNVVHIQGLWRLIGAQGARWARRRGIPYVVSLRGMLYPQALGQRRWFKRLSLAAYEADTLRGAAAIHATCEEEAEHYRALGFTNRVEIIPNAVDTSAVGAPKQDYADVRTIAYLGRFDGRKRIDLLIEAFAIWAKGRRDCRLRLIGGGSADFEAGLRSRAAAAGISDRMEMPGFLSGAEKYAALREADVLVVPSDFENFGNIVVEAMACGVPVVASKGTPWRILEEERCGYWTDNAPGAIADALGRLSALSADERRAMGQRAVALADRLYSVDAVGRQLAELYRSVANR